MAQTFKYGNGVWATKEGSSLAFNDQDGHYKPLPFTTTRASSATRVNKQGLIEVVGNDRARIDYSETSKGALLLEPARTNLAIYSEDFSQSEWVKLGAGTGSTAVVTPNYAISPDGTQNASRLQCDLNGGGNSSSNQSLIYDLYSSSGNQTISIYLKSNSGENQIVYFANTQTTGDTVIVTPEWQRFTFTHSTTTYVIAVGLRGGSSRNINDTADILIWGAQVEQGSYATSYIPTSGSTATRQADTANGAGVANVFNDSEGVLYANIAALADDLTSRKIALTDGGGSGMNQVTISYNNINSNQIRSIIYNGTSVVVDLLFTVSDINLSNKIAIKYKTGGSSLWFNGFEVDTSANAFSGLSLNKLSFSSGGGQPFYGKTKQVGVYDAVLTDAELEYLTSYRSWEEMVTELNLTIK